MAKKDFSPLFLKQVKHTGNKPYVEYTDNGLILRVSSKGVKSFYYQYRIYGKKRTLTIGHYPEVNLTEARDAVTKAKADLRQGIDPQSARDAIKQAKPDVLTFGEALDRYLERHARHKQNAETYKWSKSAFNRLPSKLRKIPLKELKKGYIANHIQSMEKTPASAIRLLKTLKTAFAWFYNMDLIETNIIRDIPQTFKPVKRQRPLNETELQALLKVCQELGYPRGDATMILAYTGQRKNEICKMRWGDLDLEKGIWTITADRAKNSTEHRVPLCPTVLNILKRIPRQRGDYVFSTMGGKVPMAHSTDVKKKLDSMLNFEKPWKVHDLRHTTITNLSQKLKCPDIVVSSVVNHSKVQVQGETSRYNHNPYFDECKIALDRYGEWLDGLVEDKFNDKVVAFKKS